SVPSGEGAVTPGGETGITGTQTQEGGITGTQSKEGGEDKGDDNVSTARQIQTCVMNAIRLDLHSQVRPKRITDVDIRRFDDSISLFIKDTLIVTLPVSSEFKMGLINCKIYNEFTTISFYEDIEFDVLIL
ncbi:hypothetical protein PENTCL1PPCAC_6812, partial [Pristionchus entomophagus]